MNYGIKKLLVIPALSVDMGAGVTAVGKPGLRVKQSLSQ